MTKNATISLDKFNSEVFRLKFGNIIEYKKDISLNEIRLAIASEDFDIIGLKISSTDYNAIYNFQKAGFYLVDCLVTYEFDSLRSIIPDKNFDIDFAHNYNEGDVRRLSDIASKVFKIDRFHSDPNLAESDSNEYYKKWVENSFNGFADGVILPMFDDKIVGFTTYRINNVDSTTSTMVLSAVDPQYMGKGIYYNMIKRGTIELLKHSTKIHVGTQVDNIPVQRTWQKLGYKLIDVKYVMHYISK